MQQSSKSIIRQIFNKFSLVFILIGFMIETVPNFV